jgi:hypothetical protein
MFQTSTRSNTTQKPNYCVRDGRNGNPQLIRCSAPEGYSTGTAAKEARIEKIESDIRCYRETINGYLDELQEATKGKELQDDLRSYLGAIADYQSDIVEADREQEKVRKLKL